MQVPPLSERAQFWLLSPIIIPVAACGAAIVIPLIPFIWAATKFNDWRRDRLCERGQHLWFAWRPVRLHGFYYDRGDRFVWLETVERRFNGHWIYRFPGELDHWERRQAFDAATPPERTDNDRNS